MPGEPHTDQVLAAAFAYAARGWHVFPCRADKRPYTRRGFKQASTKPKRIRKWWRRWPKASIGVACGASRLVVIDCDVKYTDGPAAFAALGFDSEQAWRSATPSGGSHYIFADTSGGLIRNSAGKLAAGVDVRAAGGYFIAPPSSGYRCLNTWSGAPADLPPNLAQALLAQPSPATSDRWSSATPSPFQGEGKRTSLDVSRVRVDPKDTRAGISSGLPDFIFHALQRASDLVAAVPSGQRNDTLNRAAFALGKMVGAGWVGSAQAAGVLEDAGVSAGLDRREVGATVRSGLAAGTAVGGQSSGVDAARAASPLHAKQVSQTERAQHAAPLPNLPNEHVTLSELSERRVS